MQESLYHPWRALGADWAHINLEHRTDLPQGRLGDTDGRTRIRLRMPLLQVERRCTLTHELIHLERGDTGTCTPATERMIDREVARRLISIDALCAALRWTLDPDELADELWVTPKVLRARFDQMAIWELRATITAARDAHGDHAVTDARTHHVP